MRRLISSVLVVILSLSLFTACSKNALTQEQTETTQMIYTPEVLLNPRFELWDTDRKIFYQTASSDDIVVTSNSGTTADGIEYTADFFVAGEYRNAAITYFVSDSFESHHEYFDVDANTMFVAVSNVTIAEDGNMSFEVLKFFVSNIGIYSFDSATETYTLLDESEVPFEFFSYEDVIATYG